jgi:hypothetical protein
MGAGQWEGGTPLTGERWALIDWFETDCGEVPLSKGINQPRQHHGEAQSERRAKRDGNVGLPFSSDEAMHFSVARQACPEHKDGNDHHRRP